MKKTLYLECNSGISGDMTVGALLDLGADRKVLEDALASLGVDGYHLHFGTTEKCGIKAYDFDVHLEYEEHVHEHCHDHDHRAYSRSWEIMTTIMEIMTTITSILMTTAIPTITCTHTPTATSTTFTPLLTACSLPIK